MKSFVLLLVVFGVIVAIVDAHVVKKRQIDPYMPGQGGSLQFGLAPGGQPYYNPGLFTQGIVFNATGTYRFESRSNYRFFDENFNHIFPADPQGFPGTPGYPGGFNPSGYNYPG